LCLVWKLDLRQTPFIRLQPLLGRAIFQFEKRLPVLHLTPFREDHLAHRRIRPRLRFDIPRQVHLADELDREELGWSG